MEMKVVRADIGSAKDMKLLDQGNGLRIRPAAGRFSPRDGHRRRTARRAQQRQPAHRHGAESIRRVAAAPSTRDMKLDCLVLSRPSPRVRKPGAGRFRRGQRLPRLARGGGRALGLAALTINWGVLGGEGYVAGNERVAEFLARQGTAELTQGEVTTLMESSLTRNARRWRRSVWTGPSGGSFSAASGDPLLGRIFHHVDRQECSGEERLEGPDSVRRSTEWSAMASSARPCAMSWAPCSA